MLFSKTLMHIWCLLFKKISPLKSKYRINIHHDYEYQKFQDTIYPKTQIYLLKQKGRRFTITKTLSISWLLAVEHWHDQQKHSNTHR